MEHEQGEAGMRMDCVFCWLTRQHLVASPLKPVLEAKQPVVRLIWCRLWWSQHPCTRLQPLPCTSPCMIPFTPHILLNPASSPPPPLPPPPSTPSQQPWFGQAGHIP